MPSCRFRVADILLAAMLVSLSPSAFAAPVVLITEQEARLPVPAGAVAMAARGVTRGPTVEMVTPEAAVHSPLHLQIKFEAHGGAKIATDSVHATYVRVPTVDLTDRIKPYVTANGIDIPAAEVPPGEHLVRIDLADSDGRKTTVSVSLKVDQ